MINNRIFEAMSCGSIVLSDYSSALHSFAGDLVWYAATTEEVQGQLERVLNAHSNATYLAGIECTQCMAYCHSIYWHVLLFTKYNILLS